MSQLAARCVGSVVRRYPRERLSRSAVLYRYGADGVLLGQAPFEHPAGPSTSLLDLGDGRFAQLSPQWDRSSVVGIDQDGMTERWSWEIGATLNAIAVLDEGFVWSGNVYESEPGSMSPLHPYLARGFLDGTLAWEWQPEREVTRGSLDHLVVFGETVLTVSTEDPITSLSSNQVRTPMAGEEDPLEGQCSTYGCLGVVVRRFSASGELEWEYQHRSEASTAKDAAVFDGSLWVLVEISHETTSTELMRFEL